MREYPTNSATIKYNNLRVLFLANNAKAKYKENAQVLCPEGKLLYK